MNDKRSKGVPYGYANTPEPDGSSSKTGMYVIGAVVALVVIVGFVALVMTSENSSGESTIGDAVQEQAAVQVDGEPLPPYPEDGGLFADPATDPAVGMTPPTLTGQSFDGEDITIEPGTGTPMVVVFATHWCSALPEGDPRDPVVARRRRAPRGCGAEPGQHRGAGRPEQLPAVGLAVRRGLEPAGAARQPGPGCRQLLGSDRVPVHGVPRRRRQGRAAGLR